MKLRFLKLGLLGVIFFFSANLAYGNADMQKFIDAFEQNPPEEFRLKLDQFLEYGKNGDVSKMVGVTSKVTIAEIGLEDLKITYEKNYVPVLESCESFSESQVITHVSAQQTGTGSGYIYQFSCDRADKTQIRFKAFVLNEDGEIVVTSFGPDH